MNKVQLGLYGQEEAEKFMKAKGMSLIEANFRAAGGEIDLIMKDGTYVVFVEVKLRRGLQYGLPREAIDMRKQQRIKKAAMHFITRRRLHNNDFRFDAVEVFDTADGLSINHIENAFQ